VPTNFSEISLNATRFACEYSREIDAKIILFHAYRRPFLFSSLPMLFHHELERVRLEQVNKKTCQLFRNEFRSVKVEPIVYAGKITDGIEKIMDKKNVDYIMMGVSNSNEFSKFLFGSTVYDIVQKVNLPVFVIPKTAKFKQMKKCVFAHNYLEKPSEYVIEAITKFCSKFNAELTIYGNSFNKLADCTTQNSMLDLDFAKAGLHQVNHVMSFSDHQHQIKDINTFVDFIKSDCLMMMLNSSKSFSKIFQKDFYALMNKYTHLPLMVMQNQASSF
jgi:nucleotide-binding universal stress UspA family protein